MAVHGGGLLCPAALFQLAPERVQVTEHGGIGFAALEFGEALFEIIEKPRGVGSHGSRDLRCLSHGGGRSEAAP